MTTKEVSDYCENGKRLFNGPMKLNIQLPDVANALVGARILRGTISAGYSQVIPSLGEIGSVSPQRQISI